MQFWHVERPHIIYRTWVTRPPPKDMAAAADATHSKANAPDHHTMIHLEIALVGAASPNDVVAHLGMLKQQARCLAKLARCVRAGVSDVDITHASWSRVVDIEMG